MKNAFRVAMVCAGVFAGSVWAADAPIASSHPSAVAVQRPCPTGLSRLLPGNYYVCLAAADMADGKPAESAQMMEVAAGWGSKRAQFGLGIFYFNGKDVAANRPLGLAWLTLAAERKEPYYLSVLASAQSKATPDERAQAETLLARMRPVYADDVALTRAKVRFQREMDPMRNGGASPNSYTHLAGVSNIYADYASSDIAASLGPQDFGHSVPFLFDQQQPNRQWGDGGGSFGQQQVASTNTSAGNGSSGKGK